MTQTAPVVSLLSVFSLVRLHIGLRIAGVEEICHLDCLACVPHCFYVV